MTAGEKPDRLRIPLAALDLQLDLLAAVDDRVIDHLNRLDISGQAWRLDTITPAGPVRHDHADVPAELRDLAAQGLGGETMWVSAQMVTTIEQAAATLQAPDAGCLSAENVPHPAGTMWLAGDPLMITSVSGSGDSHPVIGVSWAVNLQELENVDGITKTVAMVTLLPWLRSDAGLPLLGQVTELPLSPSAASMLGIDSTTVTYATPTDWATAWPADYMEMARWMLAAWVFASQVLPRQIVSAARAVRRRAARIRPERPDWGDVHVMTLRVAPAGPGDHDDVDVAWAHQWAVRGHWRWQACGPGRGERKLIWIAPHTKGPEGAPLLEVDQVAKLVR